MKTVLFFMVPHTSHYYATFSFARALRERGCIVVYCGTPQFRPVIEQEEFVFYSIPYIEEVVVKKFGIAFGLLLKSWLDPLFTKNRYRQYISCIKALEELIQHIRPDTIFLDHTLGHYYHHLYEKTDIVQISTSLSLKKRLGIPPLNSYWLPQNGLLDYPIAEWKWFWHLKQRSLKKLIERTVLLGKTDDYFQQRYTRKTIADMLRVVDRRTSFYNGLKNVPSIVLPPVEIEFPWHSQVLGEYHVALPSKRNESHLITTEYTSVLSRCLEAKQNYHARIICVAMGTLSQSQYTVTHKFLTKLIEALSGLQDVQVIIATGGVVIKLDSCMHNIHLLTTIPQLDLLPYCDMMINHGGTGSIKDCLEAGIPMLVYPLNWKVDHPGDSARVVSRKLGLRGRMIEPVSVIRQKVLHILNSSSFKNNCRVLQKQWQQSVEQQCLNDTLQKLGLLKTTRSAINSR